MGCCLVAVGSWLSPRLALFVMWLFHLEDDRLALAFQSWWIGFAGFCFLPWTALMYALAFAPGDLTNPRGVQGVGYFLVALAFVIDIVSYTGGDRSRRRRNDRTVAAM